MRDTSNTEFLYLFKSFVAISLNCCSQLQLKEDISFN